MSYANLFSYVANKIYMKRKLKSCQKTLFLNFAINFHGNIVIFCCNFCYPNSKYKIEKDFYPSGNIEDK